MSHQRFDIVVIGSGPGGEGAAMQASKLGKSVAVVERDPPIGGGCTHKGTIPSKALRNAIFQATTVFNNKLFRDAGISTIPDFPDLRRTASSVIEKQVDMRTSFYERNDVEVIRGHASFSDANTLTVTDELGGKRTVSAANFVIASGSRPYRPHDIDFNHGRVFDSDTILGLTHSPKSITIYGAGVIGCEYATMFRNIGCKVNLVNTRDQLLEFLDDEICDALSYHLRDRGVLIRNREDYERVEAVDDGVILHLKSGKQIKTDILFWAAGRTGNSDNMGLEQLGIEVNRRGQIGINEHFQTNVPSIYAVGDVIGPPSLASAAYVQGRYAAHHMILGTCETALIQEIPTGIYTSPEISSLGKTERELTELGVPYEVGHSMFKSLARAQITGQTVGMLKILFHRETLELLGIHCFGSNASEIIHIGQAIMSQPGEHNTLMYFVNSTFNYPTMAEAYRVAALNGLNRLF
ncbi:Si-specific NAD(P)(+) transhydrogenase [Thalassoglobus sp. JC818]|uniref:Si-specific NAD(P)(+) transhydrogenase n=1 Tax=Thalassoglobus sp. JC818 TaxID=3232136 RepID=UPI00345AFCBE